MSEPSSPESGPSENSSSRTSAISVLMVDDEESVLFALKLLMEALGYSVETSSSGKDALDILASGREFDYMLCDLKMPGLSGLEVLEQVKKINSEIRFVLMSAHATEEEVAKAKALGNFGFLSKPFTPEELRGVLVEVP